MSIAAAGYLVVDQLFEFRAQGNSHGCRPALPDGKILIAYHFVKFLRFDQDLPEAYPMRAHAHPLTLARRHLS